MNQQVSKHNRRIEGDWAAIHEFVTTLYAPEDVVYVLAIESWQASGRKTNRVVGQFWFTPDSLFDAYEHLRELNQAGANIYVGVNPRAERNSPRVEMVRCIWADIDRALPDTVLSRLPSVLPMPSMVVCSGTGTHLYWMLSESLDVTSESGRSSVEGTLKRLYADIGGDSVQNVTRLLRLPGMTNQKDARNGKAPTQCTLEYRTSSRHALSAFAAWWSHEEEHKNTQADSFHTLNAPRSDRTIRRIAGLVRHLDADTTDRSKRDFSVVCGLLRLGVDPNELTTLVAGHSKFIKNNSRYLARTIEKALDAVAQTGHTNI